MTWEENRNNGELPWAGKTLCRGLEFSSYAFATGRRQNVAMGSLLDTPTFTWLDAYEEKSTSFYISLQPTQFNDVDAVADLGRAPIELQRSVSGYTASDGSGLEIPLHSGGEEVKGKEPAKL
eukprot:COSAG05_NODE_145_length_16478_cov_15.287197_16_plen_122_part_00